MEILFTKIPEKHKYLKIGIFHLQNPHKTQISQSWNFLLTKSPKNTNISKLEFFTYEIPEKHKYLKIGIIHLQNPHSGGTRGTQVNSGPMNAFLYHGRPGAVCTSDGLPLLAPLSRISLSRYSSTSFVYKIVYFTKRFFVSPLNHILTSFVQKTTYFKTRIFMDSFIHIRTLFI